MQKGQSNLLIAINLIFGKFMIRLGDIFVLVETFVFSSKWVCYISQSSIAYLIISSIALGPQGLSHEKIRNNRTIQNRSGRICSLGFKNKARAQFCRIMGCFIYPGMDGGMDIVFQDVFAPTDGNSCPTCHIVNADRSEGRIKWYFLIISGEQIAHILKISALNAICSFTAPSREYYASRVQLRSGYTRAKPPLLMGWIQHRKNTSIVKLTTSVD